jgi:hypothetical protein
MTAKESLFKENAKRGIDSDDEHSLKEISKWDFDPKLAALHKTKQPQCHLLMKSELFFYNPPIFSVRPEICYFYPCAAKYLT